MHREGVEPIIVADQLLIPARAGWTKRMAISQ
jgi:hypothetical protein